MNNSNEDEMDSTENEMNSIENEIDYTDFIMKDMYQILTTRKNPWPPHYSFRNKIQFLDKMLEYFTEHQQYEMCAGLQKVKTEIRDESDGKSN